MAAEFKLSSLSTSPAKYNPEQLLYWQKQALENITEEQFWQWMNIELFSFIPIDKHREFFQVIKPNIQFPQDAQRWAQIIFGDDIAAYNFQEVAYKIILPRPCGIYPARFASNDDSRSFKKSIRLKG